MEEEGASRAAGASALASPSARARITVEESRSVREISITLERRPVLLPECVANHRHRVLVVDDYPDSAEVVRTLIELLGHEVRIADSGRAALAEAYGFDPTIVIL